jgi:uncharacterized paraquat-inducible protein A
VDTRAIATLGSVWVLCAIMAGIVAGEKNRRFWVWFFFGLLTGPFALYRAVKSYEVVPPDQAQICPNCKAAIRKTARTCPRCHQTLVREPDRVMQAGRQAAAAFILLRRAAQKSTAAVKAEQAKREARKQETVAAKTRSDKPASG